MTVLTEAITAGVSTGHIADHLQLHDFFNGIGDTFNVTDADYGASPGATAAANTTAINSAFTAASAAGTAEAPSVLVIPQGQDFPVTNNGVTGASNVILTGGGTLSTTVAATVGAPGHLITFPAGSTGWSVIGVNFKGVDNSNVAIKTTSCRDYVVDRCKATNCTLIRTNADIATYATIDTTIGQVVNVVGKELTSNVAKLYLPTAHRWRVGTVVTVAGVDATFNGTYTLTAVTYGSISYAKVAANVANAAATGTATATAGNVDRGFRITDNDIINTVTSETNLAAILVLYVFDGVISGNRISGYHQGVQWWGGNAGADEGALGNERKCGFLEVTGNVVTGSLEGGIWGSMATNVNVTGNTVAGAGDICIDFEGCSSCTATGNTVSEGENAGLTTFFECADILFAGNTVTTSVLNGRLARLQQGSGIPTVKGIRFVGNIFTCLNGVGYIHMETAHDVVVADNTLRNCAILTRVNNQKFTVIEGNTLTFDVIASTALVAMDTGNNNLTGELTIRNNTVISTVTQIAGSKGIYVDQFDGDNPPVSVVEGNRVNAGFPTSIEARWANPSGIGQARYLLRNNLTNTAPVVTESGVTTSITVKEGNRNSATLALWP